MRGQVNNYVSINFQPTIKNAYYLDIGFYLLQNESRISGGK